MFWRVCQANEAIELLREKVDTLIVIANDKLLQVSWYELTRISREFESHQELFFLFPVQELLKTLKALDEVCLMVG